MKGEVRLKLFSDSVESLAAPREAVTSAAPTAPPFRSRRRQDRGCPLRRHRRSLAAEALRGSLVEIDRSALPPLEEGEYYHADLIGLPAVDRDGNAIGTVIAVENYGAGDLLEIERPTASDR